MKVFIKCLFLVCLFVLGGCNMPSSKEIQVDYKTAEDFEAALNSGVDGTGKIVTFKATDFKPDSAFGYNLFAGEHLNFCSSSHPEAKIGDTITVRVEGVQNFLGSYIITYKRVK